MPTVNFKLSDLPESLRKQAERQLFGEHKKASPSTSTTPAKRATAPIRLPKKRTPNETEERYNADLLDGMGRYEACTFSVPSGKYTPDWIEFHPDGIVCHEVKGDFKFGSQSGASAKFKEAVELYPSITWVWAKWTHGEWHITVAKHGEQPTTIVHNPDFDPPVDLRARPPAPARPQTA